MVQRLIFFVFLIFLLPAVFPLVTLGFYEPHDLHHLADIYEMYRAIESGQIPPRWGPDFMFGSGYPLFNFYYLTPFYLGALFFFIFGSLTLSFKMVFLVSAAAGFIFMFLFLREFFDRYSSFAGSVLFLYTPYRAVQIYVRGAMGEALALSFFPLVLFFLIKLYKEKSHRYLVFSAFSIAVLILTHNYFWVLAFPLSVLVLFGAGVRLGDLKRYVISFVFAIGLCFYWIVPALVEQRYIGSKTPFLVIDHFPFIKQLILPSWGYGSSVWGAGDEISFQIGIVNLLIIALVCLFAAFNFRRLSKDKHRYFWFLMPLTFFVLVFFMNIRSYPIWRIVPFYDFIQFPWRLLMFTTFVTSFLTALLINGLRRRTFFAVLLSIAAIILNYSYFKPSKVVYKNDEVYLERFFESKDYSEDYLLLPVWSESRPKPFDRKYSIEKGRVTKAINKNNLEWYFVYDSLSNTNFEFRTLYFPGWGAKVDGAEIPIRPTETYGQIIVEVPAGEHRIDFFWSESGVRLISDLISAFSIIVLIYIGVKRPRWRILGLS